MWVDAGLNPLPPIKEETYFMPHDPVDLNERRATTAQEIEANWRQCLKDFQDQCVAKFLQ